MLGSPQAHRQAMILVAERGSGLAGVAGVCLIVSCSVMAAADVNPDDSATVVATAVSSNRDSAQFAAFLGLLGAVLFGIFVARLYGALRLHTVSHSWVPVMSLIGGILVISAVVTEIGLAYAVSEFSFADEGQLARFFVLWSWNSASIYAPGFALVMVGGTAVEPSGRLFPDWFRPLSWALFGFSAFMVVARAPGLGVAPAVLWVGIVSILLTFRTDVRPRLHDPAIPK